ncbi:MAG: helix-turn-helix domain-containing protein [Micromonosporaceae bacterium]|nr:helix-turn-helix domain-containing protein [Micromonosporaceae bacterium]
MWNRAELAAFLRSQRERRLPDEVGLPGGGQRRTPGLRRQEVAQLAGVSVDYYVRIKQARGPHPSRQVLSALARALLLTRDEREYLFRLAGENSVPVPGPGREVTPAIRYLLDSLVETPAYVVDAKYDVLAWNALATHFIGDLRAVAPADRNLVRWMFRRPDSGEHWNDPEALAFARASVADLRAAYGRYPGDPGIEGLVAELRATSARFAGMWAAHEVEVRRRIVKRVDHPEAGRLEFECQVLHVADSDQRMIVYCAAPGSPTQARFRRLAALNRSPELDRVAQTAAPTRVPMA